LGRSDTKPKEAEPGLQVPLAVDETIGEVEATETGMARFDDLVESHSEVRDLNLDGIAGYWLLLAGAGANSN